MNKHRRTISRRFFIKICPSKAPGFIIAVFILFGNSTFSQVTRTDPGVIEDLIEDIAQQNEAEADYNQIADDLYYYLEHPLNLNEANTDDLEKLWLLNDFQVKSLLDYIHKNGGMTSLYELQLVEGLNYNTIRQLLPFVSLAPIQQQKKVSLKKQLDFGNNTLISRVSSVVEQQNGYYPVSDSIRQASPNNYYLGNTLHIYTRYAFNYKKKLQWGFTAEKDPGESMFDKNQPYGFDFYSAHLQISDLEFLKTFVIGDFKAQFGQGLVLGSNSGLATSSNIMGIRKRGQGINRYSSTDENGFFRGSGLMVGLKGVTLSVFGSVKNIDANLIINDSLNEKYFSSFQVSGIHGTPGQAEDKDAVKETVYGANLNWQYRNFRIGTSGLHYGFNQPYKPEDSPENSFKFKGSANSNASADMELRFKALHIFSEAAMSENGGKALLAGALMELTSQVRTSVLYHNYAKDYQALYSNAFAKGSSIQNEQGFYLGCEMNPVKYWKISAYYDFYQFPFITSSADSPSKGNEYLVQADYTASENLNMYFRFKQAVKEQNTDIGTDGIAKLAEAKKTNFRYQFAYSPYEKWELKSRIEASSYNKPGEDSDIGFLIAQDIIYKPADKKLAAYLRYAVFDAKTWDTRFYIYENDVLYGYSVPVLYNKGTRMYLLIHYQLTEKLDFWIKAAQTWYADTQAIGSGLNQINGNTKSEVKFQVRFKF